MIPVVPLPVFPYSRWDPVLGPDLLVSHADRDTAADILCAAVADGRLTLDELDERLEHVLSARTLREIAWLISDLPGDHFSGRAKDGGRRAAPRTAAAPRTPADPRTPGGLQGTAGPGTSAVTPTPPRKPPGPANPPPGDRPRPAAESRWSLLQSLVAPADCP
jgi:Domain of unknown function (DUF1707)